MQINLTFQIKLIFFCFALIGLNVSLYSPVGTSLYLTYNVLTWLVISLLIGMGLWALGKNQQFVYSKLFYYLAAGTLCLLVPLFYPNSDPLSVLPRIIGLLAGCLLFIALYQLDLSFKDKLDLLFIVLLAITIQALLGVLQIYFNESFGLIGTQYELLNNRPSGVFRQPNVMASLMATGIALAMVLRYYSLKSAIKPKYKLLIALSLLTCPWVLIHLQSKTGYLGATIALLVLGPIFIKYFSSFKKYLALTLIGLVIGLVSFNLSDFKSRGDKLHSDDGIRTDIIKISYNMFIEQPLLGYGYGKFERNYIESHYQQMKLDPSIKPPVTNLDHPHNELLLWSIEGGLIAFIGFLIIFSGGIAIFKGSFSFEKLLLFSLIIPILLHTQLEKPFYLSSSHWLIFIVFVWFIDSKLAKAKIYQPQSYLLAKLTAILIPVIAVPFLVTTIHAQVMVSKFIGSNYQQPQYLSSIINHMGWHHYFEQFYNNTKFYGAYPKIDQQNLLEYIEWGYNFVQTSPRSHIYENVILAINVLDGTPSEINGAFKEKVMTEAQTLYPKRETWGDIAAALKLMKN